MRVMDVLRRIKGGDKVMVSLTKRSGSGLKYCLADGTEVKPEQFEQIKDFMAPCDTGLFDGAEPQTYVWAG